MLIRFIVANYKSFKEKTVFKPIAGNYKRHLSHVFYAQPDFGILRSSAIYGNNASGKSNLMEAIRMLHQIVTKGASEFKEGITIPKFKLDKDYLTKPTSFEIEFFKEGTRYFYSLEINSGIIQSESLKRRTNETGDELFKTQQNYELIFERKLINSLSEITYLASTKFNRDEDKLRKRIYSEVLLNTQPFLLEGYQRRIGDVAVAFEWFSLNLDFNGPDHILENLNNSNLINSLATNQHFLNLAGRILNSIILGISNLKVIKTPFESFFGQSDIGLKNFLQNSLNENPVNGINFVKDKLIYNAYKTKENEILIAKIVLEHISEKKDIPFELYEESLGTQKIFQLLPVVIDAVTRNKVFLIDEIESSIHSVIIYDLLKIYLNAGSQYEGQILFTTHECNLLTLDLFRQDEIWFTEKNLPGGYTSLYSLSEFKPRFDKNIKKGYLKGQFNELPFFTEPSNLKWYANE